MTILKYKIKDPLKKFMDKTRVQFFIKDLLVFLMDKKLYLRMDTYFKHLISTHTTNYYLYLLSFSISNFCSIHTTQDLTLFQFIRSKPSAYKMYISPFSKLNKKMLRAG